MKVAEIDPRILSNNPWNPNVVDPINLEKLKNSLKVDGQQKAVLIRTLPDGEKQILDGQHRVSAAISLDWEKVWCVDLGEIDDGAAKKHTLIGNSRYGNNDPLLMANLLSDEDIGSASDLIATLPFDESTLTSYFEHATINLDEIAGLDELDDSDDLEIEMPTGKAGKTHQVLRFKVSVDDATRLTDLITKTKHEQGFTESDDLTNAGDALVYLFGKING